MTARLKLRVAARFLASIFAGTGTAVRKDGLATYIDIDYTQFGSPISTGLDTVEILVFNSVTGEYNVATLQAVIASGATQQIVTAAGGVNVAATDGLIALNKTVGAATTVSLPASSSKIGPVKIVDWKGDAGTNNITVSCVGSDKLNGNLTSWTIGADGASIELYPLKDGTGYGI